MGCINSKKDINDLDPNIFYVINIDDDGTALWSGQLEVSRTELTLYRKGKEPTTWPLKCLRRYGFNVDQFSFEAGRRCTTGEGIYAFKCTRAETLFYTVQSYIQGRIFSDETTNPNDPHPIPMASTGPSVAARSVSQNNTATRSGQHGGSGTGSYVVNRAGMATSQSLSPNGTIHSNSNQSRSTDTLPIETNYLEPTPNRPCGQPETITTRFQQGIRLSSVSSGPVSPDVTSPSSPNSVSNILEVTTLNPLPSNSAGVGIHHGVSNLYQEFPVKDSTIHGVSLTGASIVNRVSLDAPPKEIAPITELEQSSYVNKGDLKPLPLELPVTTPDAIDPSRMYMNVNIGCLPEAALKAKTKPASKSNSSLMSINNNSGSFDENQYQNVKTPTSVGPNMFAHLRMNSSYSMESTRCYANLEPSEIKTVLFRGRYSKPDIFANVQLPESSEPCTPTTAKSYVNYCVLDLNQSQQNTSTGSEVTSPTATGAGNATAAALNANNNNPAAVNLNNAINDSASQAQQQQQPLGTGLLPPESPKKAALGYATIDFDKTFALSNSTTPSSELDSEGSRKTRHNSTVTPLIRQSNSVSD